MHRITYAVRSCAWSADGPPCPRLRTLRAMSPRPSCNAGNSPKPPKPFSPALRLRLLSSRWSKCADVPMLDCDKGPPACCCCCCCWCCAEEAPKRVGCPSPMPPVCCVLAALAVLPKRVVAAGCVAGALVVVLPVPAKRLPAKGFVEAGCWVDCD